MSAQPLIPPEEEGEIVIKGTYTTRSGQEVPVEIHTNQHGLIYQRWREELASRPAGGGEVRELQEGEIYEFGQNPVRKPPLDREAFARQGLAFPKSQERTLIEIFAEEKAKDLAKIQLRLDQLRAELKRATNADQIRAEILDLEKKLLGDP
jgi:hypothetical protein